MSDQVTLKIADEYGLRCKAVASERRDLADVQRAMSHPEFEKRHIDLLYELSHEYAAMLQIMERPVRIIVEPEPFATNDDLIAAMDTAGVNYDLGQERYTKELVLKAKMSNDRAEGYEVTPGNIGFSQNARRDVIYDKAASLGLASLAQDLAARIALKCARQLQAGEECDLKVGEYLIVASEPIFDSHSHRYLLYVERQEDGVSLDWDYGGTDYEWDPGCHFLFLRK